MVNVPEAVPEFVTHHKEASHIADLAPMTTRAAHAERPVRIIHACAFSCVLRFSKTGETGETIFVTRVCTIAESSAFAYPLNS